MSGVFLTSLYVYPIKSVGGIALREARLDSRGIEHDRRWMLVDENGKFMSQRKHPRMALISTRLTSDSLIAEASEMPKLHLPLQPEGSSDLEVQIWSDVVRAVPVRDGAGEWFSTFLGVPCRLVYMPDETVRRVDQEYATAGDLVGFADSFPLLLISQASVDDLGKRLGKEVPVNRFRPNLVVEGCEPFDEDGWRGLRIGEVSFRVAKPCSRCSIVMTDQNSGERDREVLAALSGYRQVGRDVLFGQNLAQNATGTLHVGATVEVFGAP